jgi:hypothetical protein
LKKLKRVKNKTKREEQLYNTQEVIKILDLAGAVATQRQERKVQDI